jgi:hypothetical protein
MSVKRYSSRVRLPGGHRAAELPGRGQDLLAGIDGPVVAEDHGDDRHASLGFGDEPQVSLGLIWQGHT